MYVLLGANLYGLLGAPWDIQGIVLASFSGWYQHQEMQLLLHFCQELNESLTLYSRE